MELTVSCKMGSLFKIRALHTIFRSASVKWKHCSGGKVLAKVYLFFVLFSPPEMNVVVVVVIDRTREKFLLIL